MGFSPQFRGGGLKPTLPERLTFAPTLECLSEGRIALHLEEGYLIIENRVPDDVMASIRQVTERFKAMGRRRLAVAT